MARDGAAPTTLFDGAAGARWTDGAWDLSAFAGQSVRLDLCSHGGGATWGEPVDGARPGRVAAPPASRTCLRLDDRHPARRQGAHLQSQDQLMTPNYDAFCRGCHAFLLGPGAGTWSLPSRPPCLPACIRRSTRPPWIRPRSRARCLSWPSRSRRRFSHGHVLRNGYVSSKWGFDRGFDENRNLIRESLPTTPSICGAGQEMDPARQGQTAVRLSGGDRAACHLQPAQRILLKYWDKPYKGPINRCSPHPAGQDQTRHPKVNDTDKPISKPCTTRRLPRAIPPSGLSSRISRTPAIRHIGGHRDFGSR